MVIRFKSFFKWQTGKFLPFALLSVPILGHAAAITTSVVCTQGFNQTVISNASSCILGSQSSGNGPSLDGYSDATASVSYSVAGNLFISNMSASAYAAGYPFHSQMEAQSDATFGVSLFTEGPVRPGVVKVLTSGGWGGSTGGNGGGITSWSLQPTTFSYSCLAGSCSNLPPWTPFTLGSSLQFLEAMDFNAVGNSLSEVASVSGDTALTFEFFEADGVTPVSIYEVPEPASWLLLAIGCVASFAFFRIRNTHHRR